MTIEELSRSLDKTEALTNYGKVKEEVAVLRNQLAKKQAELSEYKNLKSNLCRQRGKFGGL
jgi:cell shape-determining protein MreC